MSEEFEVSFKCNNCGHEFTRTFERGTLIKEGIVAGSYRIIYGEERITGEIKKEGSVKCGNCNTFSQVIKVP